jgi:[ribosomal protein S18]-alanine N-acetyltransferase
MFGWLRRPMAASIRHAEGNDARVLSLLHAQGFDHAWSAVDFEAMIADRSVIGHVLCLGRAGPSGFVLSRVAADEAEILSIVIDQNAQGKGFARQLLETHMDDLVRHRARKLFLEVEAGNAPALSLYKRLAFAEIGRRRSYYRKADGSSADALTMSRAL